MGRATLKVWLRMLQRDIRDQTPDARLAREEAESDAVRDDWVTSTHKSLVAAAMTPGTLCMHLLHIMLTTGRYDSDYLREKRNLLQQEIEGGESAANHSRQMMQFSLAADRLVGESFSKGVEARLATGHQPGNIPPGSMLQGGIAPNTLLQGGIAPNTLL